MYQYPDSDRTYVLAADFYEVESGMLKFRLSMGTQSFEGSFADAVEPLLDFRHWLEAIAVGVQQCSFLYWEGGDAMRLSIERSPMTVNADVSVFCLQEEVGDVLMLGHVYRRQLVEAFYKGFFALVRSEHFRQRQCHNTTLSEYLMEKMQLPEDGVLDRLASSNSALLASMVTAEMGCTLFVMGKPPRAPKAEYDTWSKEKRLEFLKPYMGVHIADCSASKVYRVFSRLIEQYLAEG